jgi:hypothetical protein
LTVHSWFYSESLISAILKHNQVKCLDVSKLTNMVFIDLLAVQRNLRPAEEGLAIVEAARARDSEESEAGKAPVGGTSGIALAERAGIKDL